MVRQLSLSELDDLSVELEAAVDATPEIDQWCSGPDWQIPVCVGFAPTAERLLLATEDNTGFALLAKYNDELDGHLMGGLEPLWGFGTPIVGTNLSAVAAATAAVLGDRDDWHTLLLPGMPLATVRSDDDSQQQRKPSPDGTLLSVAFALSSLGPVHATEGITRQVADLSDGYDGWSAKRSPKFRRNLRKAWTKAEHATMTIEDATDDPDLFDRLMIIEHQSWKGQEGSGITSTEMSTMYRLMIDRLRHRNRLLAHVATLDGHDIGYILGGVRNERYRGLQLSFIDSVGELSVGNLLQDHQLRQLADKGLATTYDLGMDFGYKKRWADHAEISVSLVVRRS